MECLVYKLLSEDSCDKDGKIPLYYAIENRHKRIMGLKEPMLIHALTKK